MRRIAIGGVIGALPGILIAAVPVLLHEMDVITSDESQIGFIGVPLLFVGVVVGIAVAAPEAARGRALLGTAIGGVVAVAGVGALSAAGWGGPLLLILAPVGMIVGAILGDRPGHPGTGSGRPAPHH